MTSADIIRPSRQRLLRDPSRLAAGVLFMLMAAGLFEPYFWTIYRTNRAVALVYMTELPYSRMPGLRAFLEGVCARTSDGQSVAVWVTVRQWYRGYSYAYHRAWYLLPGRDVLPLVDSEDHFLEGNLRRADYLAEWQGDGTPPGFETVWKSGGNTLLRRVR